MKFFKRLNLLDYIIFIGIFLTVFLAIYNFLPRKADRCELVIAYEEKAEIRNGDICFDIGGNKELGEIAIKGDRFSVYFDGRRGNNGVRLGERVYAKGLPLEMFVGDYYLVGRVEEVYCDTDKD